METINAECRCAELEDDFLTALQRGDAPEIEEFVALHPEHAERMRQSLRRVAAIQNAVARRSLLPTSESSQPPRLTVPGYEVLGELGRGGMGIVYEARELGLDRIVALKMIRGAVNLGDESRSRFQREAKAVAKLQHPNIVQIYQIGEHDGQPFISLELVEGGNLDRLVAHQPQPARDVVTLVETLARAVHSAHERGIIHRDLKPANILMQRVTDGEPKVEGREKQPNTQGSTRNQNVSTLNERCVSDHQPLRQVSQRSTLNLQHFKPKITDFGLAKVLDGESSMTHPDAVMGTPSYMAPEQASRSLGEIGPGADVYALGAILYDLLLGHPPFRATSVLELLRMLREEEPVAPRILDKSLDRDLETICLKCLEKDPQRRYQSAANLADDLHCYLDGDPIQGRPASAARKLWRQYKRRPLASSLAVLVALTVVVVIAALGFVNSATGVSLASEQKRGKAVEKQRDAEQKQRQTAEALRDEEEQRRKAVEAHKLEVETLLTQREHEAAINQLKTGSAGPLSSRSNVSADTSSWDTRYLNHALSLRPHPQSRFATGSWGIVAAVYDDASHRIAVAHADGDLSVWDAGTQKRVVQLAKPVFERGLRLTLPYALRGSLKDEGQGTVEWFTGLAWLADGKQLAAATASGRGLVFDVMSGESRERLANKQPLMAVAATSDGKSVLFGDSAGRVVLRSLADEPSNERAVVASEPSAITSLLWHPALAAWIIGDAAGRVQVLEGVSLETVASVEIVGPVWSLAAVAHKEVTRIAVGGGDGRVTVYKFDRDSRRLLLGETLLLPPTATPGEAAHALRFDPRGERLWAIDRQGSLIEWDVSRQKIQWTNRAVIADARRLDFQRQLAAQKPPEELPLPFRRTGAAILATAEHALITAGDDGLVSFWSVPPRGEALWWGTTVHERLVGLGARLVFSATHDERLWALDRDGQLIVADVATGQVLARRAKAHSGTAVDLAALPDGVVTVGGDTELRFWRMAKKKIEPARPPIPHDRPLISVAASADGKWVAAVDDHSGFGIWKVATGEQQFLEQLPGTPGRPLTGRTRFHSTGAWLAVLGAGQSGYVFELREQNERLVVRRLPDQINVAGLNGGTALAWSPAWPDRLIHADDHPRLTLRSFGETAGTRRETSGDFFTATVVDIIATPDKRRLLWVDQQGHLVSMDARHELPMVQLDSSLKQVGGLAIDRKGQRLALVNDEGTVELWHTSAPVKSSLPEPKVATVQWTESNWLNRDSSVTQIAPQTLRFDSKGRACFLATETHPGDFRSDGALYFIAEEGRETTREQITVGKPEFDRRMDAQACALQLHNDQPLIVFRCRTAERSPYDGAFYSAKRTKPGVWEQPEKIHEQGNLGFYPAMLLNAEGRLTDVLHFTFAGNYLLHSFRQENGWQAEAIGEQGDGYHMSARAEGTAIDILTDVNRFNGDPVDGVYLRWKPDGSEPIRERLPAATYYAQQISRLPNGQPVALQHRHDADGPARLVTRTETGWSEYQRLPLGLEIRAWEIGPDGAAYVASWQDQQSRFVLWRGQGDDWSGQIVATKLPAEPNWMVIRFDPQDRPIVAVGKLGEPFGWLKAYRRKTARQAE